MEDLGVDAFSQDYRNDLEKSAQNNSYQSFLEYYETVIISSAALLKTSKVGMVKLWLLLTLYTFFFYLM